MVYFYMEGGDYVNRKERVAEYFTALYRSPYLAGIIYIARHIQSDRVISDYDRSYLLRFAAETYRNVCARDLWEDI